MYLWADNAAIRIIGGGAVISLYVLQSTKYTVRYHNSTEEEIEDLLKDFHRKKRSEEEVDLENVRDLSVKRKTKKYRKNINVTVPKRSFNKILIKKKRKKKR